MRAGLTIGGIEIEVSAPAGPIEAVLAERYSPFLGAVQSPVCSLHLESSGRATGTKLPPDAVLVGTDRHVSLDHLDFSGRFDLEGDGEIRTAADPFTIDYVFRLLVAFLAPRHDALMLHACGLVCGGRAQVFAGRSGAGKSTLASLAGHRPLLSDEHVIVRRVGGHWLGASTPFWGSYAKPGRNAQAPLDGLWSLVQHPANHVRPLDAAGCLRTALGNAVLPGPHPEFKRRAFEVAAALAAEVPAAELRFVPTESVWNVIDDCRVA